ncbi:prepilin peptidase [Candidatus Woesearchaeota archaeon]|nr:prepilin peptidase [Candidatus Woesearchaeota archaeon]
MAYSWIAGNLVPLSIGYALSFLALFIGSITDFKTREVPDWVNYGLVISGIGINLLFSVIYSDSSFIINSILGLTIFFGIAYIMFYAGQWGGGDSKMLMGIGAMIGIDVGFPKEQFLLGFLVNALFIGALYGLLWSIFLALKNRQKFSGNFKKILAGKNVAKAKKLLLAFLAILLVALLFANHYVRISLLSFGLLAITSLYLWIFVKAIEKTSMYKLVEPGKLTEGDWIAKDVFVGKKYICGPKDLGIEKKQIRQLIEFYKKRKVGKILIKEGIPFVPSFFLAFIVTFVLGNPLMWML